MSVSTLLDRIEPALSQCASPAGMTLVCQRQGIEDSSIRADPQTVERILLNLVENAGKYAGEASDRRIHLIAGRQGEWVSLSVRDHGPGVSRSERGRIFRAFQRGSKDAHGPKSGLGLGLALAKELASELDGRLTYQAPNPPGALFALTIPAVQSTK
jgi:K+-sensing histidine kinase KdpD